MSSKNLENVIINFHHLVQTGFSASLSKRKSCWGQGDSLESVPGFERMTHPWFLTLNMVVEYLLLRQPLCNNDAKNIPNTLRLMESNNKKNLRIKSPK